MMKRSLFLALAAGLFATMAFATPSQAGSILVDTTASFTLTSPPSATATDFTYNSTNISGLTLVLPANPPSLDTATTDGVNHVTIHLMPATGGPASFEWKFTSTDPSVGVTSAFVFGGTPPTFGATTSYGVTNTPQGVPEPASVALLGIGMTGFLAFRRFFKKTPVA
jgi:hypothetical protein